MKFLAFRRFVHFGLLVLVVVIVRACGGANEAEDRMSFGTRWLAEKTGLTGVKETLDTKVRPPIAAATRSMTYAIYGTASRALDATEMTAESVVTWFGQQVDSAAEAVQVRVRSVLTPNAAKEPQRPEQPPSENDATRSSSR
jgi:hypothetical protein